MTPRDPMCPYCGSNIAGKQHHACSVKMPCGWCGEDPETGWLVRWEGNNGPCSTPRLGKLRGQCHLSCTARCPRTIPAWCTADYLLRMIERWWYGGLTPGAVEQAYETEHGPSVAPLMLGIFDAIERHLEDPAWRVYVQRNP